MPDFINTADAVTNTPAPGLKVYGDPDGWVLECKAAFAGSDTKPGWSKSTKWRDVPGGAVVQVTTEHRNLDGVVTACAEAVAFVPLP